MTRFSQSGLTPIKRLFNYRLSKNAQSYWKFFLNFDKSLSRFYNENMFEFWQSHDYYLGNLLFHNMFRQLSYESHTPEGFIDMETESEDIVEGEWREENVAASVLQSLPKSNTRKATKHGQHIRDAFANPFWGSGQIPWQWKRI